MLVSAMCIGCQKPADNQRPQEQKEDEGKKDDEGKEDDEGKKDDDENKEDDAVCDWADYLISLEYTIDDTQEGYAIGEAVFSEMKDVKEGKTIAELLGYDSYEALVEAVGVEENTDEEGNTYYTTKNLEGDVQYFGNDPVSGLDITDAYNTNREGYWCSGAGSLSTWGDDNSRIYTESSVYEDFYGIGVRPDHIKANENYVIRNVWQKTSGGEVIRVGIEAKVKVEAFVDPESSLYNSANRQAGTFTVTKNITVPVTVGYEAVQTDLSEIQQYIQLTKYQLAGILGDYEEDDETGEMIKGFDVVNIYNDEVLQPNAGGVSGNWMGADGIGAWGDETGAYFVELYITALNISVGVGTMPEGTLSATMVGQNRTYKQVITYIPDYDDDPTIINLVYNISFTE